jgi:hypothetical protein
MLAGSTRFNLGHCLLGLSLLSASGCLSCFNPVAPPKAEWLATCQGLPQMERSHVFIFMMNGLDPFDCCNLTGVRDCVQRLGFIKTYYGQPVHYFWFASELRRLAKDDPQARFVLVGSQLGANVMCALARDVAEDGVPIDLAVFLDGGMLNCDPSDRPTNIHRIVNLWSAHALLPGRNYPDAENVCVKAGNVLGCGPHPDVLERLALELALVAASIPIETDNPPEPEEAPMPRSAEPQMPLISQEWDFLMPKNRAPGVPVPMATKPADRG